jgi:hypothetical protein
VLARIGFTCKTNTATKPEVMITVNDKVVVESEVLNYAGNFDDASPKLHYIEFNTEKVDCTSIKIHELNITNKNKADGDFGFCVAQLVIDYVDVSYFYQGGTVVSPIPSNSIDDGYVTSYLQKEDRMHELVNINGQLMHRREENYANYVNMPNSYYEFAFQNSIYAWLFKNNFGYMLEI